MTPNKRAPAIHFPHWLEYGDSPWMWHGPPLYEPRWAWQPRRRATATKHFPKGLDGRMQDKDAEIRKKRGDTHVGTLRETYGENFAAGRRFDMRLDTLLKQEGVETLDQYLKKR